MYVSTVRANQVVHSFFFVVSFSLSVSFQFLFSFFSFIVSFSMEKTKWLEIELYVSVSIMVEKEKKQTNERTIRCSTCFFIQIIWVQNIYVFLIAKQNGINSMWYYCRLQNEINWWYQISFVLYYIEWFNIFSSDKISKRNSE